MQKENEVFLDQTARALAMMIEREKNFHQNAVDRPVSYMLKDIERKCAALHAAERDFRILEYPIRTRLENALHECKRACLTLQACCRVLDRYYNLKDETEILSMIEFVECLQYRTIYYVREGAQIRQYLEQLKAAKAAISPESSDEEENNE